MTVKEIKEKISQFDDDMIVLIEGKYRIDNIVLLEVPVEIVLGFAPEDVPKEYAYVDVVSIE